MPPGQAAGKDRARLGRALSCRLSLRSALGSGHRAGAAEAPAAIPGAAAASPAAVASLLIGITGAATAIRSRGPAGRKAGEEPTDDRVDQRGQAPVDGHVQLRALDREQI